MGTLTPGKEPLVPTGQEAGLNVVVKRKESLPLPAIKPTCTTHSPGTILSSVRIQNVKTTCRK